MVAFDVRLELISAGLELLVRPEDIARTLRRDDRRDADDFPEHSGDDDATRQATLDPPMMSPTACSDISAPYALPLPLPLPWRVC